MSIRRFHRNKRKYVSPLEIPLCPRCLEELRQRIDALPVRTVFNDRDIEGWLEAICPGTIRLGRCAHQADAPSSALH
jgi:hypothetical protein